MKTPGQNLLALLVGRPATKVAYTVLGEGGGEFDSEGRRMSYGRNSASQVPVASYRPQPSFRSAGNPRSAYTVLGQGGGEYDSDGRSLTQPGHRWGQGRVSMDDLQDAQYRQDSRNRMNAQIASWERRQSDGRQRLSDQWVARQGYGTDDPFGIRRQYQQRRQQAAQGQQTWMTQNAELLKQHPELQRYAGYFSRNPAAWQKWQADAGLAPNTQTPPASVAAAPQPQKTPNVVTWSEGQPLPATTATARATSPLQPATPKSQTTSSTSTLPTTADPSVRNVQTWSPGQNLPGMNAQQTAEEQAKIQAQQPQSAPRQPRSYADRMAMMNQKFESFGGSVSGVFRGSGSPSSGGGYSQEELVKRYPQLKQYVDKGWYGGGKQPAAQSYTTTGPTTPPGLPVQTAGSSPAAKTLSGVPQVVTDRADRDLTKTSAAPWTWGDKYGPAATRLLRRLGRYLPTTGIVSGSAGLAARTVDPDVVHDTLNNWDIQRRGFRNAAENAVDGAMGLIGLGTGNGELNAAYRNSVAGLRQNMKTPLSDDSALSRANERIGTGVGPVAVNAILLRGLGAGRLASPSGLRSALTGARRAFGKSLVGRALRNPRAAGRAFLSKPFGYLWRGANEAMLPTFAATQGRRISDQLGAGDVPGTSGTFGELAAGIPLFRTVGPLGLAGQMVPTVLQRGRSWLDVLRGGTGDYAVGE